MTPKEKAEELIESFMQIDTKEFEYIETGIDSFQVKKDVTPEMAKQCALIAVEEIMSSMGTDRGFQYWQEVKQEIQKL